MPILIRGIKSTNYDLVKKATVCTSNLCALIKDPSDISPFMPLLMPLLEQNVNHSLPVVRTATEKAKENLLQGAGDLKDLYKRPKALAEVVRAGVVAAHGDVPAEVVSYIAETCAALLEEKLGGVVRYKFFVDAVGQTAEWISSNLCGLVKVDAAAITKVADAAVERFKEELSE